MSRHYGGKELRLPFSSMHHESQSEPVNLQKGQYGIAQR